MQRTLEPEPKLTYRKPCGALGARRARLAGGARLTGLTERAWGPLKPEDEQMPLIYRFQKGDGAVYKLNLSHKDFACSLEPGE